MKSSTDGREKLFPTFSPMRSTLGILFGRKPTRGTLSHISSARTRAKKNNSRLAEQPERITQPGKTPAPTHTNTQVELDDVLNTQPLDEDAARSLICKLAQEQYDAIGNEEYETERLRRLFAAFECTAELNAELLQSAVTAVLVTRQAVRLQLKNGQIIGKDDLV